MNPQMQVALRILQLTKLELVEEVRREIDEDPILRQFVRVQPAVVDRDTADVKLIRYGRDLAVRLNDQAMPRLTIDEKAADRALLDRAIQDLAKEKRQRAQWLVRAIDQRGKTIVRVAECIVDRLREFWEKRQSQFTPLTLVEVAEAVGMHESTIALVVTDKFMSTPDGVFELKAFFVPTPR